MPVGYNKHEDPRWALDYIKKHNLDLTGGNPDPFGLGGAGSLPYRFQLTNKTVCSSSHATHLIVKVETSNICDLVLEFQGAVQDIIEKADRQADAVKSSMGKYLDE